jgi:hypothetical protein
VARIDSRLGPPSGLRLSEAALVERAEFLDDLRVAEEQVARGEAIEHDDAKRQVLARFTDLKGRHPEAGHA